MKPKILMGLSLAAAFALCMTSAPLAASAAETGTIRVGTASARAGEEVTLNVTLDVNPGIVSAVLEVRYDTERLTLSGAADGELLDDFLMGDDFSAEGFRLTWDGSMAETNNTATGTLATLTFRVKQNAPAGDAFVSVKAPTEGDIIDCDLAPVAFTFVGGNVQVTSDGSEETDPSGGQGSQGNEGNQGGQGSQGGEEDPGGGGTTSSRKGCFGTVNACGGVSLLAAMACACLLLVRKES